MAITQTRLKQQTDEEKYSRELGADCRVKRVASTPKPPLRPADERLCNKIDVRRLNAKTPVFCILRLRWELEHIQDFEKPSFLATVLFFCTSSQSHPEKDGPCFLVCALGGAASRQRKRNGAHSRPSSK